MSDLLKFISDSAFIGALAGATISGLAALTLNSRESKKAKEKEKEEAKKVLLLINYQAKVIDSEIVKIVRHLEELIKAYDPNTDVKFEKNQEGYLWPTNMHPEEAYQNYTEKIKPYLDKANKSIPNVFESYSKMDQINIHALSLKQMDGILQFKSRYTKFVEPILIEVNQEKAVNITMDLNLEEIKAISAISENLLELTNKK